METIPRGSKRLVRYFGNGVTRSAVLRCQNSSSPRCVTGLDLHVGLGVPAKSTAKYPNAEELGGGAPGRPHAPATRRAASGGRTTSGAPIRRRPGASPPARACRCRTPAGAGWRPPPAPRSPPLPDSFRLRAPGQPRGRRPPPRSGGSRGIGIEDPEAATSVDRVSAESGAAIGRVACCEPCAARAPRCARHFHRPPLSLRWL